MDVKTRRNQNLDQAQHWEHSWKPMWHHCSVDVDDMPISIFMTPSCNTVFELHQQSAGFSVLYYSQISDEAALMWFFLFLSSEKQNKFEVMPEV